MEVLRRMLLIIVLLLSTIITASATNIDKEQISEELKKEEFISEMNNSIQEAKKSFSDPIAVKIPHSMIIGMSILESAYGSSYKARKKNNFFGLKSGGDKYAKFDDMTESVECLLKNLSQKEYYTNFQAALENGEKNPHKLIAMIQKKYAEDAEYAKKVSSIIKRYGLQKYDFAS